MSRELLAQIIGDFGQEIGAQLEVDEDAYCCLGVGDNMQIHIKFNEHFDGMILYSELGDVPEVGKKEILRHYVLENGRPESGCLTFSYDNDSKKLGMERLLLKDFMNLENFKKILEGFIVRFQKEREAMDRYMQGELPKDTIGFLGDEEESATSVPEGFDPMFNRM